MIKYIKENRKLSIISDFIIFILLSIAALLVLGIFKEIFVSQSIESESAYASLNMEDPIDVENLSYVTKIKEEYHIDVKYGTSQKELAERIGATTQLNNSIINNNLKILYNALGKYNKEMFKNFYKEGYKLNLVIFDKFNNENLALASRNKLNQFTVYISNTERLERAFHHEMCHVLEYYLSDKSITFDDWNMNNPEDFKYLNDTKEISSDNVYYFSRYSNSNFKDIFFVTKYSKVNEKEDRAEIFAEVMIAKDKLDYIEDKSPIYYKYISIFNTFKLNIPHATFANYYNVAF